MNGIPVNFMIFSRLYRLAYEQSDFLLIGRQAPVPTAWLSWRVSILKDQGMYQTQYAVCIKRQSQSQLIVRSAVITSVISVLLCGQEIGVSHNATTRSGTHTA
jgi:hypothetical protein